MFIANAFELTHIREKTCPRRMSSRGKSLLMTWGYKYCAPNGAPEGCTSSCSRVSYSH